MSPAMSDPYLTWPTERQDVAHATLVNNLREQRAYRVNISRQLGVSRAVMLHAQAIAEANPTPQNLDDYEQVHSTVAGLAVLFETASAGADKMMEDIAGRSEALRSRVEATLAATEEQDAAEAIPAE